MSDTLKLEFIIIKDTRRKTRRATQISKLKQSKCNCGISPYDIICATHLDKFNFFITRKAWKFLNEKCSRVLQQEWPCRKYKMNFKLMLMRTNVYEFVVK